PPFADTPARPPDHRLTLFPRLLGRRPENFRSADRAQSKRRLRQTPKCRWLPIPSPSGRNCRFAHPWAYRTEFFVPFSGRRDVGGDEVAQNLQVAPAEITGD